MSYYAAINNWLERVTMRKYLLSVLRPAISQAELARIHQIQMPVTKTYAQVLKELEREVDEFGISELVTRLRNEAYILADLKIKQTELDQQAIEIVTKNLVNKQAQGYDPDIAIEYTAARLEDAGLTTEARLPMDELISGLEVRKILFDRNQQDLESRGIPDSSQNRLCFGKH